MSMSTHVWGIIPPDGEWKKMKAVWDACRAANINPPEAVSAFFRDEEPDAGGVLVNLKGITRERAADGQDILEVDLAIIPRHVKTIRLVNSY